jgi:pyrimidine oxygenase
MRAKTIAAEMGKTIKTYAMCTMVHAETDAAAEAAVRRYNEAADFGAIANMLRSWGVAQGSAADERARGMPACNTQMAIGSPSTCAEQLETFIEECALDGVMLIFPDYVEGLDMFGREVLPRLGAVHA